MSAPARDGGPRDDRPREARHRRAGPPGLKNGPKTGPFAGPKTWPFTGPKTGPKTGPFTGLKTGLKTGPFTKLKTGPKTGPFTGPKTGPFTGPPTSAQLMGLRHLSYIAEVQGPAPDTAPEPSRRRLRGAFPAPGLRAVPWPLLVVLAVQVLLAMRLIWSDTPFIDEATYLFVGSQDFSHWIHGVPIEDYQTFLSGSPVVYPPVAAIANAVGGLTAARFLSLAFMTGATCLLYVTAARLFDKWTALVAAALFAGLAGTQFLGALATYDPMSLFLLVLSAYLVVGRKGAYDSLTGVAFSTVIAGAVLAVANACKYATAAWDPVVVALACCAPAVAGHPWRYGLGRALRLAVTAGLLLAGGLAVGKAKYVRGILSTTVARSSTQVGMGQPASLVVRDAWNWIGLVVILAVLGVVVLLLTRRSRFPHARRGAVAVLCAALLFAAIAAPLNQAIIGTSVSLQKHVVFGAWFGCLLAGYAVTRVLRARVLIGASALVLLVPVGAVNAVTAQGLYHWPAENPAFISALRHYVRPGSERYLISGYADIPAYYIGDVSSLQWKEAGTYSYTDPATGRFLLNGPAFADAVKRRVFTLIILNFQSNGLADEPGNDYLIAADIARYHDYQVVGHLPPDDSSSHNYYTVWRVTGKG